jgi:alanine-synthesizing transaminase
VSEFREVYKRRRDVLVESFGQAGWDVPPPAATMFAWAPIPEPFAHLGSLEFSKLLLSEAQIAVAPGLGFGEYGDGFVRIGLVENRHRTRQAARNIKRFFADADNILERASRHAIAS